VGALVFPMAVLFVAIFAIYWAENDLRVTELSVAQAYDARSAVVRLQTSLLDAQSALAVFLAQRDDRHRTLSQTADARARDCLAAVQPLASATPETQTALQEVPSLGERLLTLSNELRTRGPHMDAGPLATRNRESQDLMAGIESRLIVIGAEQDRLFAEARYQGDLARQRLFRTVVACGVFGPMGALFILLLVSGRMVRRIKEVEENARRLAGGLPLEPFPHGSDEIASLARQLEDAAVLLRERDRDLRQSERRYRDLFENAPLPYEETDCEGVVTRFNQAVCTLLKCTPNQIMGRRAWDFVDPSQRESVRSRLIERVRSGVETGPFECECLLEDGSRIAVEIRESLIRSDSGRVTGTCRSLTDVTERNMAVIAARKVEQYAMELRNKNEQLGRALDAARSSTVAKSRFLASVSHELRTPLNGIIGFSEMMFDGRLGPISDSHKDCLSDILSSARHLLQLINDILDLSKVEAGKTEFRPELCSLGQLVREVRDVIRPLAEKKRVSLIFDPTSDIDAFLDASRFKQVLYNYLSNAVKFTAQDGRVSVRLTHENGTSFRLEVEDTGIGIPPEEIPALFQEFQQAPNSRRADQGTGLGLALTRHIVEAQGGSVGVRSAVGQGSTFWAVLPLGIDSPAHP
jgi:PAS domain S-box-containing protein